MSYAQQCSFLAYGVLALLLSGNSDFHESTKAPSEDYWQGELRRGLYRLWYQVSD